MPKLIHVKGTDIPVNEVSKLTERWGLMQVWLAHYLQDMGASLYFDEKTGHIIAWCGYVKKSNQTYEIGTFVSNKYRLKGIGTEVLRHALESLKKDEPNAFIRYGAIQRKFDERYRQIISDTGLQPIKYFG